VTSAVSIDSPPGASRREWAEELTRALATLTPVQQRTLLGVYRDGQTLLELATALRLPLASVRLAAATGLIELGRLLSLVPPAFEASARE
jgi:DNA-directed RNA polymerase specialized sigma24 family protein